MLYRCTDLAKSSADVSCAFLAVYVAEISQIELAAGRLVATISPLSHVFQQGTSVPLSIHLDIVSPCLAPLRTLSELRFSFGTSSLLIACGDKTRFYPPEECFFGRAPPGLFALCETPLLPGLYPRDIRKSCVYARVVRHI